MAVIWGFMKFKADPVEVWREIQTIGEEYTPKDVLEYARSHPSSELHKCFEWGNKKAAENWRLQQARWVCNSLSVTVEREEKEPETYRIIQHDKEAGAYRPVIFTARNEDQYARLLKQAKAELQAFTERYRKITELQDVIEAIQRII